jgi:hypothetical protein
MQREWKEASFLFFIFSIILHISHQIPKTVRERNFPSMLTRGI